MFIAAALYTLVGCFYIPQFNAVATDKNYAKMVGPKASDRAVRVSVTTYDEVIRHLGPPRFEDAAHHRIAYGWTVHNGVWIWPFCFTADQCDGVRTLELDFDDAGILKGFQIRKVDDDNNPFRIGAMVPPFLRPPWEEVDAPVGPPGSPVPRPQTPNSSTLPSTTWPTAPTSFSN